MSTEKVCGIGIGETNLPLPGDPDNLSILSATAVYGGIRVHWTYPETNPHALAYTILYRGTSGTEDDIVRHAIVSGDSFLDPSPEEAPVRYYYWIQFVSIHGSQLEPIGPETAIARPRYEDILNEVSGEISEGVLAQGLRESIGTLSLLDQRIYQESVDRLANDRTLGEAFNLLQDDLEGTMAVVKEETIARADADSALVNAVNQIYANTEEAQAAVLTEETARIEGDDALAERIVALASESAAGRAAIQSTQTVHSGKLDNIATELTTLYGETAGNRAAVKSETTARTQGDQALGQRVDSMAVEVDKTNASVLSEAVARADGDTALAKDIDALFSTTENTDAMLVNEASTRAAQDSALSSAVQSLSARLDAQPLWVSSFEPGSDYDRWRVKSGGSLSSAGEGYAGQAGLMTHTGGSPSSAGAPGTVYATISESMALNFGGKRVRVTGYARQPTSNAAAEFAVAYSTADVGNSGWQTFSTQSTWTLFEFLWDVPEANNGGVDYLGFWADTSGAGNGVLIDLVNVQPATTEEDLPVITAAIQEESEARVSGDESLAKQITTTQSQFGDNIASVEQQLETNIKRVDGTLEEIGALYTVKVGANNLVGGFGIYNDNTQVEAGFDVDRFWIGRAGDGGAYYPFILQDNNILFNGSVQFSNVQGAGSLASKDSLAYNDVQGNKPPEDADRTSSNTALDTQRVGGMDANTLKYRANRGDGARHRTDYWTKPGTTLINGNTIYTRDAFIVNAMIRNAEVDTLKIRGQAVTIPTATASGSKITTSATAGNPRRVLSTGVWSSGAPIIVTGTIACMLPGSVNSASYGRRNYIVQLRRDGKVRATIYAGMFIKFNSYTVDVGFGGVSASIRDNPGKGWHTYDIIVFQQTSSGTYPLEIRNRSIVCLEVKR